MKRILFCGDRNWTDIEKIKSVMMIIPKDSIIVHGNAKGADRLSALVAMQHGLKVESYPAKWNEYGRAAGPIRNQEMLESGLDFAYAFHSNIEESKGTKDMVNRLTKNKIPFEIIK